MKTTKQKTVKITIVTLLMYLTVLLFMIGTQSCNYGSSSDVQENPSTTIVNGAMMQNFIIDSCEYIGRINGKYSYNWLSHKGNCFNPIHKQNQVMIHDTVFMIQRGNTFLPFKK